MFTPYSEVRNYLVVLKPKLRKIFQIVPTSFPFLQTRQWNPSLPQQVTRPHPRNNRWIRVPLTRGRGRRGMPNRCPLSGPLNTLNQRGMERVCASEFSWRFKSLLTVMNFLKQWKLGAHELPKECTPDKDIFYELMADHDVKHCHLVLGA